MKIKPNRLTDIAFCRRLPTHCSVVVLAALGVFGVQSLALAQSASALVGAVRPGALPVLRGVVSGRAVVNAPVAGASRALLTVDQATQAAILDWHSFNIGKDAEVRFNQPSATATALNRIYSADPTVILGKLTANGQVLLINQNGILFGNGSQINVQSLVASTLNISNEQFNRGNGALTLGGLSTPAFAGGYDDQGNTLPTRPNGTQPTDIVVGVSGNGLTTAANLSAKSGGSIILIAPRIDNQNSLITAPDGQVLLAAGAKVYLALPDEDETVLRGMRVEVEAAAGSDVNLSNLIRNAGTLSADRGNVTLAALAINQEGRVSANTAVQASGSVYLQARTRAGSDVAAQAGTATFKAGSVTQVLPDTADRTTLPDSESYVSRRGVIQVDGRTIDSAGSLSAPGGRIVLNASDAADPTGARIYLDRGSSTSVAGNVADVDFRSNLLTFTVTSNELRDAPDQKNGVLRGQTVTVDLRKANPTLSLDGYISAQARSVAEKAAVGGELQINSSGSVIQREGATLDASGGGYRYSGGAAATTKLLSDDGRIFDIGTAPKDRTYTRIADRFVKFNARYNQTQVYDGLLYGLGQVEESYFEGKSGGSIAIGSAAGLVLDGTLKGGVTIGPNQLNKAPRAATFAIGGLNREGTDFIEGQRIGNVTFRQNAGNSLPIGFNVNTALNAAQRDQVILSADQLFAASTSAATNTVAQGAFGGVEINSNGRIVVPDGVHIDGAPGQALLLRAPEIDIAGSIDLPAGQITLQPQFTLDPVNANTGVGTTVRSTATLSTAGLWLNSASVDGSYVGPVLPSALLNSNGTTTSTLNGGSIVIAGPLNSTTRLERGSTLDVGGGAAIDRNRRLTNGNGGTLTLVNALSENLSSDWLQADLQGFAVGNGASLTISTPRVVIDPSTANGTLRADTTRLLPELFADHGFSSVQINTSEGLAVNAGTTLNVQQKNRVIDVLAAPGLATGGDLRTISTVQLLPNDLRQAASVGLSSTGSQTTNATLNVDAAAAIVTDPRGRVTLRASDGLQIDGSISAPGGTVSARLTASALTDTPDLTLGATARISVAGTFVPQPNTLGLVQGSVIGAGTITFEALNAGVDLVAQSRLDLNGVSQTLDFADATQPSGKSQRQADGNAGTLVVRSQGAVSLGSTITANRASAQSAGGSFALDLTAPDGRIDRPDARRIVVTQSTPTSASVPQSGFLDAALAIDPLQQAGFDKLRLLAENSIRFDGDVALNFSRSIRLDTPLIDVQGDNANVHLNSAAVALGQSLGPRSLQGNTYELSPRGASPALDTRAGNGVLSVQSASSIDLFGSTTLNGVREARLSTQGDIQLTGRNTELTPGGQAGAQVGSLTTEGNVFLTAAQVFPSTRGDFTLSVGKVETATSSNPVPVVGGAITVARSGQTPGAVYSAGGKLTLNADNIVQGGVVKAPQGELDLRAVSQLELGSGSVTSVSADGLTVPLGTTSAGIAWTYVDGSGSGNTLSAPSRVSKRVELAGQRVDVRPGATVDISGGGDVQAIEFVPGNGGTLDTLLRANTYAIIPKARLGSLPVDADIASRQDIGFGLQTANPDASTYNGLYIGEHSIVPAGEYVLLPARYALLPDAFLVQLQTGSTYANLQPGQTVPLVNGQTVVGGFRTVRGTDVRESTSVGVLVRPGSDARRESDYTLTDSSFFANAAARDRTPAPRLPIDAGRLAIVDVASLTLAGQFKTNAGSKTAVTGTTIGRNAEVDVSAERIAVVDHVGRSDIDAGYLQLDAAGLSALGGSVLIGGRRSDNADGSTQIATGARQVLVANGRDSEVKVPELLVAAIEDIEVRSGSVLSGTGTAVSGGGELIRSEAGGALLRLSSGTQATIDRGNTPDTSVGNLRIEAGATLRADRSVLLDATRNTQSQGTLTIGTGTGGALSLASSQVSLGQIDGVTGLDGGLVLSNAALAGLTGLDALAIRGYQGIDLYGAAIVGGASLGTLTLDSGALRGHALAVAAASSITAKELRLVNRTGVDAALAPARSGPLTVATERLVLGAGSKSISGFNTVTTTARNEVIGEGTGALQVAADWTVKAPRVGVAAGAQQTWRAVDASSGTPLDQALKLERIEGASTAVADSTTAGGRLRLEGRRIDVATAVQARAGAITLVANGTSSDDGVMLASGAVLDARGLAKNYNGNVVLAGAGDVELSSVGGAVTLAAGSTVDVRGVKNGNVGGDAGGVRIDAPTLVLGGVLNGAAEAGSTGGRFTLDAVSLADFSGLNAALNQGGFNEARAIRLRHGDLHVQRADIVTARELSLSADDGRIDIEGTLNARTNRGNAKVDVWAAHGLALTGATVWADGNATGADAGAALSNGGQVRLASGDGTLSFDAASTIDVRPGAKGGTGNVTFTAARDDGNALQPVQLNGTVLGVRNGVGSAANVVLEAKRVYDIGSNIADSDIAGYANDHANFIATTDPTPLLGGLHGDVSASLHGATELRAEGNLTLNRAWDLTTNQWLAEGRAGTLTLRAPGDLTVSAALGLPNDNLLAGDTWNLRLVGGADLSAANPLATQTALTRQALANVTAAAVGNVSIDTDNGRVRTGNGTIEVSAAADFSLTALRSVIYTAGQIGAPDTEANGNNRWARNGGSISIAAGRDAIGHSDEWITEWLRRPRTTPNGVAYADWWAYRPNFQQGVGTLGGGDIRLSAGHDVNGLSALLPTSGRNVLLNGSPVLDVQGGGDLRVTAGNDVKGGAYLIARGDGLIRAGGDVGADTRTQLFLQGVSSGDVPQQASLRIEAGGSVSLQSVNNPTATYITNSRAQDLLGPSTPVNCQLCGPSFAGTASNVPTFFSYSANSGVDLIAKSGDIVLGNQMRRERTLLPAQAITPTQVSGSGAYPASLRVAAFEGDISNDSNDVIVTYPSASAQVSVLAQGSLHDLRIAGSDLSPSAVADVNRPVRSTRRLTGADLLPIGSQPRLVQRSVDGGFVFDLQALSGNIDSTGANAVTISLPALSRVRAGQDIVGVALALQNLNAADVSEVRSDFGDVRPANIEIRGPGRLLVQAGRNIDLGEASVGRGGFDIGGVIATGNTANASLSDEQSARITLIAGVIADVDLAKLDASYAKFTEIAASRSLVFGLYNALATDPNPARVLSVGSLKELADAAALDNDNSYARYIALGTKYPQLLVTYQAALRAGSLPLNRLAETQQADALYTQLNGLTNTPAIINARSVADLLTLPGGDVFRPYLTLDAAYPRVFGEYQRRLRNGVSPVPVGLSSILYADVFTRVIDETIPTAGRGSGGVNSYLSSIQTYGGSDIDLWAPNGDIVVGLTTPRADRTIGVVTNAGGAIRSVLNNNFNINQGKVLTAQGGDILILSSAANIDAGKGARTSLSTPPPKRTAILVTPDGGGEPIVIGYRYTLPASASGSGIQTLTSDPDGLGPRTVPLAGSSYLITPAGVVDAGEAGIRSEGNVFIDALAVRNASNISSAGTSVGVPVAAVGSIATSLAAAGTANNSKAAEDAAASATNAARAAASAEGLAKPTILTVEVLGFGDKNCKEQQKDCFGK